METTGRPSPVTILHNATIVTMDGSSHVFRNDRIAIAGDTIIAVGRSPEILAEYSLVAFGRTVNLEGHVILPGLES